MEVNGVFNKHFEGFFDILKIKATGAILVQACLLKWEFLKNHQCSPQF